LKARPWLGITLCTGATRLALLIAAECYATREASRPMGLLSYTCLAKTDNPIWPTLTTTFLGKVLQDNLHTRLRHHFTISIHCRHKLRHSGVSGRLTQSHGGCVPIQQCGDTVHSRTILINRLSHRPPNPALFLLSETSYPQK
jgi:hypothetical protein